MDAVDRADAAARTARATGLRHPLPADHAGDHGQGRRGHRVLPLRAAARAQRRRRRPVAVRDRRGSASTPATPSAPSASRSNLLTTMTHDAKRSADVRARIGALASMPDEWRTARRALVRADRATCARGRRARRRRALLPVPDAGRGVADRARADRGVHGEGAARGQAQHQLGRAERRLGGGGQALRAARCTTTARSWTTSSRSSRALAQAGERAALGQLVLKLTAPGVPDIYQGDELPFRALVDPDNRRPVDLGWRQAMLRRLMGGSPAGGARPASCS